MVRTLSVYMCAECPRFYDSIDHCVRHELSAHTTAAIITPPIQYAEHTSLSLATPPPPLPPPPPRRHTPTAKTESAPPTAHAETTGDEDAASAVFPVFQSRNDDDDATMESTYDCDAVPRVAVRMRDMTSMQCPYCPREYTHKHWKTTLMRHINATHVRVLMHCPQCDYATRHVSSFSTHKRKHLK